MATTNYKLQTITSSMTGDIPRDMNALANATDGALKGVKDALSSQLADMSLYLNYMPINGGTFDGNEPIGVVVDGGTY